MPSNPQEEQSIAEILTLGNESGRLELVHPAKTRDPLYSTELSPWRQVIDGRPLQSWKGKEEYKGRLTKIPSLVCEKSATLCVELGFSGSDPVWRTTYLHRFRDLQSVEITEPEKLVPAMSDLGASYNALRTAYNMHQMSNEDTLLGVGRYIEARLPRVLRGTKFAGQVVHTVPEDNNILLRESMHTTSSWGPTSSDPADVRLKSTVKTPFPAYLRQLEHDNLRSVNGRAPSWSDQTRIVLNAQDSSGRITVETFIAMPQDAKAIQDVPNPLIRHVLGAGTTGHMWNETIRRAVIGYREFRQRDRSGSSTALDDQLRARYKLDENYRDWDKLLDHFLTSALQPEIDQHSSMADETTASLKVCGMSRMDLKSLSEWRETGVVHDCLLRQAPEWADSIRRIIQSSEGGSDERQEQAWGVSEGAAEWPDPPPSYSAAIGESGEQDADSELAKIPEALTNSNVFSER